MLSCSVMSDYLRPYGLQPARLLCLWGCFRQEYWNRLPCPHLGDLPNPGMQPRSPTLQEDSLPAEPPGKPFCSSHRFISEFWRKNGQYTFSLCFLTFAPEVILVKLLTLFCSHGPFFFYQKCFGGYLHAKECSWILTSSHI